MGIQGIDTQSISPLLRATEIGSIEAANAIIVDLLISVQTTTTTRSLGHALERHPVVSKFVRREAPGALLSFRSSTPRTSSIPQDQRRHVY